MQVEVADMISHIIENIGKNDFHARLARFLRSVVPYDYTVVFGHNGRRCPKDLFDDFPAGKRRIFVDDYQEGPYLLDPFYLAATKPVKPRLYRMRELAPDRFYQGEYFRSYYMQTGLAEEIGFFIDTEGEGMVVWSMMRKEKAFSAKQIRELTALWPLVRSLCRAHWAQPRVGVEEGPEPGLQRSIQQAFQNFGGSLLTPREREVAEFTLKGHSAEAVGTILEISPGTVRIHRRNIYAKLRINSQGELFSHFIQSMG